MGYRYLVFGAEIGGAIAHYLALEKDTEAVTINDINGKKLLNLVRKLEKISSAEINAIVSPIEALNLVELIKQFDGVVSALPARFNYNIAAATVAAKKHYCDLGGVLDVTQQIGRLDSKARSSGISIATDEGLGPGMATTLGFEIDEELGGAKSLMITVGGLPQKPRPPLKYQRVYSDEGHEALCYDNAPVLRDGKIIYLPARSECEITPIPALNKYFKDDKFETFITAGSGLAPWRYQERGVHDFCERTVRLEGFCSIINTIPREKFKETIGPMIDIPVSILDPDLVYLKVEGIAHDGRTLSYTLIDEYDDKTGFSAMSRTTAIPAATLAVMQVQGKIQPGFNTADAILNSENRKEFLSKLSGYFSFQREKSAL